MKPFQISVLVPVYNGLPFLEKTIKSILAEDDLDFKLLILDDGSTDGSWEYVQSLSDPKIQLFHKPNSGVCETLNWGVKLADSDLVARLDQDDLNFSNRLKIQLSVFENNPDIDCVFSNYKKFGELNSWENLDNKSLTNLFHSPVQPYSPEIHGLILHSTMMIKRKVFLEIGGYRNQYYPADDWDLSLRLAEKYNVIVINKSLVSYRFHNNANTYKYFWSMQSHSRWAKHNHKRRLNSESEISLHDFKINLKKEKIKNIIRVKKDYCKFLQRRAGEFYLYKKYLLMLFFLFLAFCLRPVILSKRTMNFIYNYTTKTILGGKNVNNKSKHICL